MARDAVAANSSALATKRSSDAAETWLAPCAGDLLRLLISLERLGRDASCP